MDLFERISKSEGQSYQPSFNVDSKSKKSRLTSASDRSSNPQQQPQWSLVSSRVQSKTNKQRLTEQNNVRSSQETQLSLRSSGSSDVENTGAPGKFKVMFQMERKVAYKEDCNIISKIITGMVVLFFVFFLIDFCYEWRHELDRKEIEVKQCSDDFVANHCIQPIDALVEECARLSFCASRQPGSLVKLTEVFCNTLVSLLGTTLSHMQIPGVLLLIGLIVAYLNRPTMYEQQKVRKYF